MKHPTTIALACILLSACSGSESGNGGVTVVTAPAPAPVATPAPAPAPTPSPTPTPVASVHPGYGTACDGFATTVSSYAISANIRSTHADRSTTVPDAYIYSITDVGIANYSTGLEFKYDAKARAAAVHEMWQPIHSFTAADIVSSDASRISYRNGTRTMDVVCEPGSSISFQRITVDLRNPALGVKESVFRAQLSGVPTGTTDTPSGNYTSTLSLETFRTDQLDPALRTEAIASDEPFILTYDKGAGTLNGRLRTTGSEPLDVTITIDRQIGTRFTGTVTASNGAKGTIDGGFYGPGGREIGYVTTFSKYGFHYAGSGSGRR